MMHYATLEEVEEGTLGYCDFCGEPAFGVEPDARKYTCEVCSMAMVYGLEELAIMGQLEIVEDEEEDDGE